MIPTEIGIPTYRTSAFKEEENDDDICKNLNTIEEVREQA